ncbi:uncharacterized protein DUF3575 [Lutibacter sp. Hel_I_33_5]|uniref:DUF3575 domain-containing protein n=1 Tax=Lutibacter sp. Hel_I_33_5 TaxID=1566289 RepID=UPI00119E9667|nr:DUF3575 domain-containing protein [Lutibacter sp. Hel_I_33_5]TVZ55356.1 uncharacterized protein DUF3575 [Lutibacter sp. Hel_I_33_5]
MKKIILIFLLLFCFKTIIAQKNAIKVNPLGLALGIANIGFEFKISDNQTASFSALYAKVDDIDGFGAGIEQRFYFDSDEAFMGWHAGPSFGVLALKNNNHESTVFSIAADIGHQWVFKKGFLVDAFAGVGYLINTEGFNDLKKLNISIGVSIGYFW